MESQAKKSNSCNLVYLKEKLMKALLIIIPLTMVLLIIVLFAKRKREALYRKRRKFWLQQPKADAYHRRTRRPTKNMLPNQCKNSGCKFLSPKTRNLYSLRSTRDSRTRDTIELAFF